MTPPYFREGEVMDRATFHARYLDTPEDYHAELIGGVVYPRGRITLTHGRSTGKLLYAIGTYDMETPGVEGLPRVTVLLDEQTEAEPDLCIRVQHEVGGRSWVDDDDFLSGPPECLIEICDHDTERLDTVDKLRAYERGGIGEYIILLIRAKHVLWYCLEGEQLIERSVPADGILCPRSFPGLRLDTNAVFEDDIGRLHATVEAGLGSPEHTAFVAELARRRSPAP